MTIEITQPATYVPLLAGLVIPFVVAWLAKPHASPNVQTVLALIAAGLTAVGTYLADVSQAHSLAGALSVMVTALISAAASRITLTQHLVTAVNEGTPGYVGSTPQGP